MAPFYEFQLDEAVLAAQPVLQVDAVHHRLVTIGV
jgi:hypothetical protein